MKRTRIHGWKKLVALLLASGCVTAWAAGQLRSARDRAMVTNMMDQKQTVCVLRLKPVAFSSWHCLQSDNTLCVSDEVMSDPRRFDEGASLEQQFICSSASNSIAKLVSTLP
jgi:hypothetical protein